jgi:hypothetical protein
MSVCSPRDVGMSQEKLGQISVAVQGLVDNEKIAGASVLVARKGKVAFFETFGMMEKVSGEPLDEFFQKRIFKPLGMKDTAFYVPKQKVDRFAACYGPTRGKGLRISDNPRESRFLEKPGLLSGGGGLVSTAGDYLRFCSMLLNQGELEGKRLLRDETVDMMTKNQLPGFTIRKEFEYEVQYNEQQDTSNIIIVSGCGDDAVVRPDHWSE